jgi:hypothetical protein
MIQSLMRNYTLLECGKCQIFENILASHSFVRFIFILVQSFSHPQNSVVVVSVVV